MDSISKQFEIKEDRRLSTLIIADSGFIRDGLNTLLVTLPTVEVVGLATMETSGLELSKELHPDVILVDCTAANNKGLDFIRQVKAESVEAKIVIIAESYPDGKTARELGIERVLLNGYSNRDLQHTFKRLIENDRSWMRRSEAKEI